SALALRAFLRSKVEQRIPTEVVQLRERLDLWYGQRALDVQALARRGVGVDGLARLSRSRPGTADAEVGRYLSYVLDGLPQYSSLFLLDPEGRVEVVAGQPGAPAAAALRGLASAGDAAVSGLLVDQEQGGVQVVSSAVRGRDGRGHHTPPAGLRRGPLE